MPWDTQTRIDVEQCGIVELGTLDASDMVALTLHVFTGYVRHRTIEVGRNVGMRSGSALVAMASERLKSSGYQEVGGVRVVAR
jgi:hypothetical protein